MAADAIFVIDMEDVLLAKMVSGETTLGRAEKIACLTGNASETAYYRFSACSAV